MIANVLSERPRQPIVSLYRYSELKPVLIREKLFGIFRKLFYRHLLVLLARVVDYFAILRNSRVGRARIFNSVMIRTNFEYVSFIKRAFYRMLPIPCSFYEITFANLRRLRRV